VLRPEPAAGTDARCDLGHSKRRWDRPAYGRATLHNRFSVLLGDAKRASRGSCREEARRLTDQVGLKGWMDGWMAWELSRSSGMKNTGIPGLTTRPWTTQPSTPSSMLPLLPSPPGRAHRASAEQLQPGSRGPAPAGLSPPRGAPGTPSPEKRSGSSRWRGPGAAPPAPPRSHCAFMPLSEGLLLP